MHHIVASYLQSQAEALQSSRLKNFEKPESLLPGVTKSIASTYDFVAALLSFLGIFFFIGSFVLICLDLNTTFFLLPPPSPPVHCKQQRGKCSLSQPGASVSSPHRRYLSVGF